MSIYDFSTFDNMFFGEPVMSFNTGHTKDMSPVFWTKVKDKNCYRAEVRSVGVNPEDIKVEVGTRSIVVSGKSEYEKINYDFKYTLPVPESIISDIEKVSYKVLNGMTYIYVFVKKTTKPEVTVSMID